MRSMNQKYKLSKLAESDLTGIWRYTAETWSQDQANRYVKMIMDAFNEIAKAPAVLGRSYEHVRQGYAMDRARPAVLRSERLRRGHPPESHHRLRRGAGS